MKIIHCGDIHLDSRMNTHLGEKKAKERRQELLNTFQKMIHYADENNVRAILIAGDLFDTQKVLKTTRNVILEEIRSHSHIIFFYLKGNHDATGFLSELEEIPDNLKLFGKQWKSYALGENIRITGMEIQETEDYRDACARQMSLVLDEDKINIVMLHGQEMLSAGTACSDPVYLKLLQNRGIDYLALGHLHTYKTGKLDARGDYCYSGCLEGRGFDECGTHGFVLLTVDEKEKKIYSELIPFAGRNLYEVTVDITGCMESMEIVKRIREVLWEKNCPKSSLLKIVLTGEIDVECEMNLAYLTVVLQPDYYFLKVENQTKFRIDAERYAGDISLKGEFIRTVQEATGLTETDKNAIIRYGLQSLSGEGVE